MDRRTELVWSLAQTRLEYFAWLAFGWVYPHRPYWHSPPLSVLGDMLERCCTGEVKRLIINMPPQSLKSFYASIALPAWLLAHKPESRVTCYSASREMARDQHTISCELMTHPYYRALFPHLGVASTHRQAINLTHGGSRTAAVASTHNGMSRLSPDRGSDIVIVDDPVSPTDAWNIGRHVGIQRWFDHKIDQRIEDREDGVIIVVMQRLHVHDLTAKLLKRSDWTVLSLPAVATGDESFPRKHGDPLFRRHGEALCPQFRNRRQYLKILDAVGPANFMAYYQQQPFLKDVVPGPWNHKWWRDADMDMAMAKKMIFGIESEELKQAEEETILGRPISEFMADAGMKRVDDMTDEELLNVAKMHGRI